MIRKTRRGKEWNRDGFGRPAFRSSTWSKSSKNRDPKNDRRNWEKSKGANAELALAKALGLDIYYEAPLPKVKKELK